MPRALDKPHVEQPISHRVRRCYLCGVLRPRGAFAPSQWADGRRDPLCKHCRGRLKADCRRLRRIHEGLSAVSSLDLSCAILGVRKAVALLERDCRTQEERLELLSALWGFVLRAQEHNARIAAAEEDRRIAAELLREE